MTGQDAVRVDAAWSEILRCLERGSPGVAAEVRAPAAPEDIRRAEEAVGGPLPADLARWWRLADGMDGHHRLIPQLHTPMSVDAALRSRLTWLEVTAETMPGGGPGAGQPAGSPVYGEWLPQWLPIASDHGGTELFVDLRPGPARGCVGEFYSDGWEFQAPRWDSVAAMLTEVAAAFTAGAPVREFRLWADEEGLAWDLPQWRWAMGGSAIIDPRRLRRSYQEVVTELRDGGFPAPPAGGWTAEHVAAHVKRNTELLIDVTERIAATDPAFDQLMSRAWSAARRSRHPEAGGDRVEPYICYDNREAFDPDVLDRYARAGRTALADDIERLGERLAESAVTLHARRPIAYVHLVDGDTTVDTGAEGWFGVLWALCLRQLPIRLRQLRALRDPA